MATQKTFAQLVSGQIAAVQAKASGLIDFQTGSIMRAFAENVAQITLWLQGLILALLATVRASTSAGADLDSWMADFGVTRLGATAAVGQATFTRASSGAQATIPIGGTIQTGDGSQVFAVTLDLTHPNLNGGHTGYTMGIGINSLTVPIAALVAGIAGNVAPGTISTITSAMPGIDSVVNAQSMTTGTDPESDAHMRARFTLYLASLSKATVSAVIKAVNDLATGVQSAVVEGQTYAGVLQRGFFYVVVYNPALGTTPIPALYNPATIYASGNQVAVDISGISVYNSLQNTNQGNDPQISPSWWAKVTTAATAFMDLVSDAVDAVRPAGSSFAIYPATLTSVGVTGNITVDPTFVSATVEAAVEAAWTAYIEGLGLGVPLDYNRLIQVAYDASPGVLTVAAVLANGAALNITPSFKEVLKAGVINATVL